MEADVWRQMYGGRYVEADMLSDGLLINDRLTAAHAGRWY